MSGINYSGTSTFNRLTVSGVSTFTGTMDVEGQLLDGDGSFGSAGQVHQMVLILNGIIVQIYLLDHQQKLQSQMYQVEPLDFSFQQEVEHKKMYYPILI